MGSVVDECWFGDNVEVGVGLGVDVGVSVDLSLLNVP